MGETETQYRPDHQVEGGRLIVDLTTNDEAVDPHLTSLALLYANWGQNRSYVDNFMPFVVDCLRSESTWTSVSKVRKQVQRQFGIDLPHGTVKALLKRAVRNETAEARYIRVRRETLYTINSAKELGPRIEAESVRQQREIQALVDTLVTYAERHHEVTLTPSEAESLLLEYVQDWALPVLRSSLRGGFPQLSSDHPGHLYLVKAFVLYLWDHDPVGASHLEALVRGSMLLSALYLPASGSIERRFRRTTIYLDTPFLLALLGLKGTEQQEAAEEILELAADLGAKLACFSDTLSELRRVLTTSADMMRTSQFKGQRPRVPADIMNTGRNWSELHSLATNVERVLRDLAVTIVENPSWSVADNDREHDIRDRLSASANYSREQALEHDVRALISVHRLRERRVKHRIEDCDAIFVTTNRPLVVVSREVLTSGDNRAAPVAILDHEFATLLWLKKPTAAPDLPRKQLIADCHAALNPSDRLWERFLEQVDKLSASGSITEAEYLLARTDIEVQRSLVVATGADPDELTEQRTSTLVSELIDRIEAPVREAAQAEIREARDQAEQLVKALQAKEHSEEAARLSAVRSERTAQATRIGSFVAGGILGLVYILSGLLVLLGFVGMLSLPDVRKLLGTDPPTWLPPRAVWLLYVGIAAAIAATAYQTVTGNSVKSLFQRLENLLAERIADRLVNWFDKSS